MKTKNYFSIGELSKICDLPVSTLRYYDKEGVLKPIFVDPESGYRYYDDNSILNATLLSVYKRYGFSLEKIRVLLQKDDLGDLKALFSEKIGDIRAQIRTLGMTETFFAEWIGLLEEADRILNGEDPGISLRHIFYKGMLYRKPEILPYMKLKHILVYTEGIKKGLSFTQGPLFLNFPSVGARLADDIRDVGYYIACNEEDPACPNTVVLGNCPAITAFHRGGMGMVGETYEKMFAWAKDHNFEIRGDCIERYVTDYWSSFNEDLFVTELMLPIK